MQLPKNTFFHKSLIIIIFFSNFTFGQELSFPILKDSLYGIASESKEILVVPKFDEIIPLFDYSILKVKKKDKWGLYHMSGRVIFSPQLKTFTIMQKGNNLLLLNEKGTTNSYLINLNQSYENIRPLKKILNSYNSANSSVKVMFENGKFNFINSDGKYILQKDCDDGQLHSNYFVSINKDSSTLLYDKDGNRLLPNRKINKVESSVDKYCIITCKDSDSRLLLSYKHGIIEDKLNGELSIINATHYI